MHHRTNSNANAAPDSYIHTHATANPRSALPRPATSPAYLTDERGSNLRAYGLRDAVDLNEDLPVRERMIQELDWVHDGIGIAEMDVVQGLIWLGLRGGSHFFGLMEQPWVFAGRNGPAMHSLGTTTPNRWNESGAALSKVASGESWTTAGWTTFLEVKQIFTDGTGLAPKPACGQPIREG